MLQALRDGMTSSRAIAQSLYESRGIQLLEAAEHNVKAHLAKLMAEGRVQLDGDTLRPVD
ncbi:hypothetical protein D3C72_2452200 [compost metagenome]